MVLISVAAIAVLLQVLSIFGSEVLPGYEPWVRLGSLVAVIALLLVTLVNEYRRDRKSGKIDRYKQELDRVQKQLEQVLLERKTADEEMKKLQNALEHEKNKAAKALLDSSRGGDALLLLSMLQEEGRFIDFVMEDMPADDDGRVAAVARFVHERCRKALLDHAALKPLIDEKEGSEVVLEAGYSPLRMRVIGKVGTPPMRGVVIHRGWRLEELKLPKRVGEDDDARTIVSPAELEVK